MRILIGLLYLCLYLPSHLLAQDAKLIAEGRKDGKVVIYGSMETDIFDGVQQGFEKKTGIKVDYWRAAGATVLERASSEKRANKIGYDLVLNNAGPMEILLSEGALAKYDSPMAKNFAAEFQHPQLGPSYRTSIVGIVYNKSIISPEKAPKSLEDLIEAGVPRQARLCRSVARRGCRHVAHEPLQTHGQRPRR